MDDSADTMPPVFPIDRMGRDSTGQKTSVKQQPLLLMLDKPAAATSSSSNRTTTSEAAARPLVLEHKQQRERERKRRARLEQKTKLVRMAEQVAVLEAAAAAVAALGAEDAAWDDFLDDDAKRMRAFLRKTLHLTREAARLTSERATLRQLLREHELWAATMRAMLEEDDAKRHNDWQWNVTRWHALSLAYFTPWTLEECLVEVEAAIREMNEFVWSTDTMSSGMSILGWHDKRRLDRANGSIQFCFHKTFRGSDLIRHIEYHWDVYTNVELYVRIVLGGTALASVEVLQRITPNMFIVRYDERYAGEFLNIHNMYLLFRTELERGFLLCLRSISCPEVQRASDTESDCWAFDSVWFRWELSEGKSKDNVDLSCTDYEQSIGGSLASGDQSYASRWLFEVLAAVVRAEVAATNKAYLRL